MSLISLIVPLYQNDWRINGYLLMVIAQIKQHELIPRQHGIEFIYHVREPITKWKEWQIQYPKDLGSNFSDGHAWKCQANFLVHFPSTQQ